ncbi:hypothetical protein J4204_05200 [Candidatus Woesearchaeota archaeon]|nr:hypothetical protein [Candidatus Woesearchaeota archaeon]
MDYEKGIKNAKTIADIFEIVKEMVKGYLGQEQAGLMVGVSDLGSFAQGFVGAFYSLEANTIIINKKPLARILQTMFIQSALLTRRRQGSLFTR